MTTAYDSMFERYERQYGLPRGLLRTVASIESNFNPRAMGPKTKYGHALGMFQVLPSTAADYGVTNADDLYDPDRAADVAARHLKRLYDKFGGDTDLTMAAYNAGEGNVTKHGGIPPFRETINYVKKGRERFGTPDPISGPTPPTTMESAPTAPQPGGNAPGILDRLAQKLIPENKYTSSDLDPGLAALMNAREQASPTPIRALPAQPLDPGLQRLVERRGMSQVESTLDPGLRALLAQREQAPSETFVPQGSPLNPANINEAIRLGALPAMTGPRQAGSVMPGTKTPFRDQFNPGPFDNPEASYGASYPGKVTKVLDGDTVEVEFYDGSRESVRFADINTQETGEDGTPYGEMAKFVMHNLLPEGSNVVVETNGRRGPYGRLTGRIMYRDDQGRTIDMSRPLDLQEQRAYPAESPVVGTTDDITGPMGGHGMIPLQMMAQEIPEIINTAGKLLTPKEQEARLVENSSIIHGLDSWEHKGYQRWANYMSSGYDIDAETVNVPLLGKVTLGELGRGMWSFIPYAYGITGPMAKMFQVARAGASGAKAAALGAGRVTEIMRNAQKTRAKKAMTRALTEGDITTKAYEDWVESVKFIDDKMSEYMVTIEPSPTPRSAMKMLQDFREGFIANWSNKYNPFMDLVRKVDPEHSDEMKALIQRTLGSQDIAQSGIMGGRISMIQNADGTYSIGKKGMPLTKVLRGLDELGANHVSAYSAASRLVKDLAPQWDQWIRALKKTGGNEGAAMKYLDIHHIPVEVRPETVKDMRQVMKEIEAVYDSAGVADPQFAGGFAQTMKPRVEAFTQWFDDNAIAPLVEVGALSPFDVARMKAKGAHYTPFHRIVLESLQEIAGPEAVEEMLRVEKDLASKLVEAARGKHVSEVSVGVRPIANLHKSLGNQWDEMILDPIQTAMSRIPNIQKWVEAQRVRNMLGKMIDKAMDEGGDLAKGWIRITDPSQIKKIQNARDGNGFIRYEVVDDLDALGRQQFEYVGRKLGGKQNKKTGRWEKAHVGGSKMAKQKIVKTGYLTNDVNMAEALRSISSTHLSMFQQLLKNPAWRWLSAPTKLFRTGTVLGFEFMVRNPIRDQMMAATLTRFGYVPVLDFWRGMFSVLRKDDIYEQYYGLGGAQANWINQDYEHTAKRIQDLIGEEPWAEKVERLVRESNMSWAQAVRQTVKDGPLGQLRASKQMAKRAAFDDPLTGIRTGKGRGVAASDTWKLMKGGAKSTLYSLRRFSELAEEATRVGAVGRGMRRAKKGKGVTWARSWDEAAGGAGGWMRLLSGKSKKGWKATRKEAHGLRHVDPNQMPDWKQLLDEGREITLDFARRGNLGEMFNSLYPFFNAELQDVSRFYRAMQEAPLSTTLRAFSWITIPALANWYRNYDDPAYQAQPEIEKDLFLHPFGVDEKSGKFKRMPRPIGTVNEMFGILPAKMLDWLAVNAPDSIKTLEDMLWPGDNAELLRERFLEQPYEISDNIPAALRTAMAVGSLGYLRAPGDPHLEKRMERGGNPLDKVQFGRPMTKGETMRELGKHMLGTAGDYLTSNTPFRMAADPRNLTPQAAAPIANVLWNEDPFFKSSIVPAHMSGQHSLVPEEVKTEATSPIEEVFSSILRSIPGLGSRVNPIQMGYIIRRYAGSLGHTLMSGTDQIMQESGLIERRPGVPMDVTSAPLSKAFYAREPHGSNSQPVQAFYDEWELARERLNTLGVFTKSQDRPGTLAFLRQYPETFPDHILQKGSEDIAEMWQYRRRVKRSQYRPDGSVLPPDIRLDLLTTIDRAITAHAYLIMEEYNKVRRDPDYMAKIIAKIEGYDR